MTALEKQDRDREIGERIRAVRRKRGMAMQAVGSAVGVTYQQMQKYETGANRVSASKLVQIAACLRCHPNDLLLSPEERRAEPATFDPDFRRFFELPHTQQERVRVLLRAALDMAGLAAGR